MLLTACADAEHDPAMVPAVSVKVTITGNGKAWVIAPDAQPAFSELNVDVVAANDVADPARDVAVAGAASLGHIGLQAAAPACSVTGCQWHMPSVALTGASMGLMAVVSDARKNETVWQTTYSMIVNPNQIGDNIALGGAIDASAPGYVMAQTSLGRLASALSIPAADLVRRGVFVGRLWSGRGEGTGFAPGVAGAKIVLGETAGFAPTLLYVNDNVTDLSTSGTTNIDGLFVLVGPDNSAGATSFAVPLSVTQTAAQGTYTHNVAIVRPGTLVTMPIIPRR